MARILVVDDDEGIRTLLGDVLSVANHQVDTAATVKTARALLELNFYNLLLADLMLPDGSGIQVAEEAFISRVATKRVGPEKWLISCATSFRKHSH